MPASRSEKAKPGGEVHGVERSQQGGVTAEPVEDQAVGIGEHQADRLVGERAVQVGQHLAAALEEQRVVHVGGAGEDGPTPSRADTPYSSLRRHEAMSRSAPGPRGPCPGPRGRARRHVGEA